jgi:hypothetical protein
MRTNNRRQFDALDRLLVLCEEYREPLEAMPLGKTFLDELRESVQKGADYFQGVSHRQTSVHLASKARRTATASVRQQANDLRRAARVLGARSGVAMPLPPLRDGSDRELIADTGALLDVVAPLSDVFTAHGIQAYNDLPKEIAALDEAMKARETANGGRAGARKALTDALKTGAEAAAGLEPLFLALVKGDPDKTAQWKRQRRIGPSRIQKDDVPAGAAAHVPAQPPTEKIA